MYFYILFSDTSLVSTKITQKAILLNQSTIINAQITKFLINLN